MGGWLVCVSMLGSALFSVYRHYVMISIDNLEHPPPGTPEAHAHFSNSAGFIAVAALAGVVLAFYAAGKFAGKGPDGAWQVVGADGLFDTRLLIPPNGQP